MHFNEKSRIILTCLYLCLVKHTLIPWLTFSDTRKETDRKDLIEIFTKLYDCVKPTLLHMHLIEESIEDAPIFLWL